MKQILAYALLLIGVPFYLGLIGGVIFLPLGRIFKDPARLKVVHILKIPVGIITIIIARYMFYLLGVFPNWSVLIISIVWITFYYTAFHQARLGLVSYQIGLIIGWSISPV